MADTTHIEWTDATWNIITGCDMVDAGCTNCYAMQLAGSRLRNHPSRQGLTRVTGSRAKWTGEVRFNEGWLDQPLRWTRRGMIRQRWRLECVCGRCGPWRSQPERDYARPVAASAPTTPPPPKPRG